jgi:hypothetical protein
MCVSVIARLRACANLEKICISGGMLHWISFLLL